MYSQVDKNCKVPKFPPKPQVTEESEDPEHAQRFPGTDPWDEQSMPKTTKSTSTADSTVVNCTQSESHPMSEPSESQQQQSPDAADLTDSQSTMF